MGNESESVQVIISRKVIFRIILDESNTIII